MLKDDFNHAEDYATNINEDTKTKQEVSSDVLSFYVDNGGPKGCKNHWFDPYTKKVECLPDDFWHAPGRFSKKRDLGKTQGMGLK